MKKKFKHKLFILTLILISGYILLFTFRLIYGYVTTQESTCNEGLYFNERPMSQRNYASKKYKVLADKHSAIQVDQKYEKIADIRTKSKDFENEEKLAHQNIDETKALIQFEQKSGNTGARNLSLVIGVPPENFESLYTELIKIGKVESKQITKKDKTNEYKKLNAEKASLEKFRTSLIALKSRGGKIEEFMELERQILNIEKQLQDLGVSLGDFSNDNEFCTINFSLLEGKEKKISFIHRIKVAFEWSIKYYLRILVSLFFIILISYLLLLAVEKLKVIERIIKKMK